VDDCITAVMTSPTATRTNTPSKLDHHATPGTASTAGRSAGFSRSASPPIPCCRVVSPNRTSPNPANAAPAADTRPPPSSLVKAPNEDHGQRGGCERNAQADQRNEPPGARGAHVRAKHQPQALRKRQQARADQADGCHGRCAG